MEVQFFKHNIDKEEKEAVAKTLGSVFLTTGPKTKEFETKLSNYVQAKYCVGVSSWTMGNLITLKALGIGSGDEVITSPMSFIATSNTIIQAGAKPIFVDVEKNTGNLDPTKIESKITPNTKAILPIHLYGQMCDMIRISEIARKYNLVIIEDAAHCIEGSRDGIRPGELSTAAIFSFYATKNITSGEGGAVVTNDKILYERLLKYRLHGINKSASERFSSTYEHWDMEFLGYKCNMNDIQASMLIPQINKINTHRSKRDHLCEIYEDAFRGNEDISFPEKNPNSIHARHIFTVWVNPTKRDRVIYELQKNNIGVAVNFRAIHLLSYYMTTFDYQSGDYPIAELIGNSTITIPLYTKLKSKEINYVIDKLITITGCMNDK